VLARPVYDASAVSTAKAAGRSRGSQLPSWPP